MVKLGAHYGVSKAIVLGDSLWRMALGLWFWVYGFGRMVLGVWLWAYGFWGHGFGRMVLGICFWVYGFRRMVLGGWFWVYDFEHKVWLWAYGFWAYGFGRMALGVWFGFGRMTFGRIVLGAWLLAYWFGRMVWLWAYGFGRRVIGIWFWGHSLGNAGRPSSKVYTRTQLFQTDKILRIHLALRVIRDNRLGFGVKKLRTYCDSDNTARYLDYQDPGQRGVSV